MNNRDKFRYAIQLLELEYGSLYPVSNKSALLPYINRILCKSEKLNDADFEIILKDFVEMLRLSEPKFQNVDLSILMKRIYHFFSRTIQKGDISIFKNDGNVYQVQNVNRDDFEVVAQEFAEGNESLKKLLIFLWEHGILTKSSCAGHVGKHPALLMLDYTQDTDAILNLFFQLNKYLKEAKVRIFKRFATGNVVRFAITITNLKPETGQFFTELQDVFVKYLHTPCHVPFNYDLFFKTFFLADNHFTNACMILNLPVKIIEIHAYSQLDKVEKIKLKLNESEKLKNFLTGK